jgi:hypothetical protein
MSRSGEAKKDRERHLQVFLHLIKYSFDLSADRRAPVEILDLHLVALGLQARDAARSGVFAKLRGHARRRAMVLSQAHERQARQQRRLSLMKKSPPLHSTQRNSDSTPERNGHYAKSRTA